MEKKDLNLAKFTDLVIAKIKTVEDNWRKPWFTGNIFRAENLRGNVYQGGNAFLLALICEAKNYQTPVFLTFNQAREEEITVNKGEKSFPVYFFNFVISHKITKAKITIEEYKELTKEQQDEYNFFRNLKYYLVFNLDQTNFQEKHLVRFEEIKNKFTTEVQKKKEKSFHSFDRMIENQFWFCPIKLKLSDKAYYASMKNEIVLPLKEQYSDDERYYSTGLHEIAHSTGHPRLLNRKLGNKFGSEEYAIEELIAELTAAYTGAKVGIFTSISEDNCKYLKNWIKALKESPEYLFNVLNDVSKATEMITNRFDEIEGL